MLIKARNFPGFFVATLYHNSYIVSPKIIFMTNTMNLLDALNEVISKRQFIKEKMHVAIEKKDLLEIIQYYTVLEHMDEERIIIECELEDLHN